MNDLFASPQFPRAGIRERIGEAVGAGEERRHESVFRIDQTTHGIAARTPLDQPPRADQPSRRGGVGELLDAREQAVIPRVEVHQLVHLRDYPLRVQTIHRLRDHG